MNFEPDESREHFRGIINYDILGKSNTVNKELIKKIGEELESMFLK